MSINKVSQESQDQSKVLPEGEDLHINGCIFRKINNHLLVTHSSSSTTYAVSNHKRIKALELALMDGGANGGVGGSNVRLLQRDPHQRATLTGMNEHQVNDVPIGTCAGKIKTKDGFIIGIMHQYAYLGTGATIHSKGQWQHFKNEVDDSSRKVGGKQQVITLDDYIIPLSVIDGLPYMEMTKPSDDDLERYPHVVLASDVEWNPSCLDCDAKDIDYTSQEDDYDDDRVNAIGGFTGRVVNALKQVWGTFNTDPDDSDDKDDEIDYGSHIFKSREAFPVRQSKRLAHQKLPTLAILPLPEDTDFNDQLPFSMEELNLIGEPKFIGQHEPSVKELEKLQPKLGFAPLKIIKETLKELLGTTKVLEQVIIGHL
jgi:hypothetical protein